MSKNRGHGEGTISKRPDGRWIGQVQTFYNPKTGQRKRSTVYGKTKKEVAEKIREILAQIHSGTFIEPNKMTFAMWLDHWMDVYVKNRVRPSTLENYQEWMRHIRPALGSFLIKDLRPEHLQRLYNEKLESGGKNGKALSARSVGYIHTLISMALKQAVKEQLILRNVAEAVSKPKRKKHEITPFTPEQMNHFLNVNRDHRLFPAFLLEWGTGLRRGELLGLKWEDVDLKKGSISIKRGLIITKQGGISYSDPKTEKSRRTIPLPKEVVAEMKSWKARQAEEKLKLGAVYNDEGLSFCQRNGNPMDPREFTKTFQRLLVKAGLPKIRFHDLRHTHASLLLMLGEHPKVVQERLGHSSIAMTLDTYSHLIPGMQEAASERLSTILDIKKEPSQAGKAK